MNPLKHLASLALLLVASLLLYAAGCATGQPASKQQTIRAYDNTVTLTLNLPPAPRAAADQDVPVVVYNIYVSDLLATQAADASAGTSDATSQSATPSLTAGVTGDKPIEELSKAGQAALTGGGSAGASAASSLWQQFQKWRKSQSASTNAPPESKSTDAAKDCADGSCSETSACKDCGVAPATPSK
jgi:hypothetical protein